MEDEIRQNYNEVWYLAIPNKWYESWPSYRNWFSNEGYVSQGYDNWFLRLVTNKGPSMMKKQLSN